MQGGGWDGRADRSGQVLVMPGEGEGWDSSTDRRCAQRHGGDGGGGEIKGEVVSIALMHHLHAEVGTVDHIRPGGDHLALGIED